MTLIKALFKFLAIFFPKIEAARYRNNSFAQEGEDLIILELLEYKKNGLFVDVGAHHPFRFSNTYALKRYGWSGINIEPNPELYRHFCRYRKDDINLNMGISPTSDTHLAYYEFDEPALNTFSIETCESRIHEGFKLINEQQVHVTTLEKVLNKHIPNKEIDLLSVDVEGLDLEVLKTNNWIQFKPRCVLIEDHEYQFGLPSKIDTFLTSEGYQLAARTMRNSIYLKKEASTK